MTDQPEQDQPEEIVLEGPDPRDWAGQGIGRLLDDIEAIARAQALRKKGSSVYGNAHDETSRLLDHMMDTAQNQLALELLTAYGVPIPEHGGEPVFPFGGAGKPRAFGSDPGQGGDRLTE